MRYFVLILVVFILGCATFKSQTHIQKDAKQTFVEFEDFGIRTKPVLNREYIIFLCWYGFVYGEFYPEKVLEILPFKTSEIPDLTLAEVGEALINPDTIFNPILKDYILHPKYIDYPLVGLSKHQILEMQKWMNDRYNENLLIDAKYLQFNPEQRDEDCYVIESFVIGQYEGTVGKYWYESDHWNIPPADIWQEHSHKPNFRLPYMRELIGIEKKVELDNRLIKYPFGKEDFLWKWNKDYFKVDKDWGGPPAEIYFSDYFDDNFHYPFSANLEYQLPKGLMESLALKENKQQFNDIAYIKEYNEDGDYAYPEKDSIGRMGFVIVGTDKENRPLVADRIQASNEPINNAIYRIVYNKTIDSSYLPR